MTDSAEQGFFDFEGVQVHDYRVHVIAGGGLSPSMPSDTEIRLFDKVYLLMECDAREVVFLGDAESGTATRRTTLKGAVCCIVPESFAKAKIDKQRKRDEELAEETAEIKAEARRKKAAQKKAAKATFAIVSEDPEPENPSAEAVAEPEIAEEWEYAEPDGTTLNELADIGAE